MVGKGLCGGAQGLSEVLDMKRGPGSCLQLVACTVSLQFLKQVLTHSSSSIVRSQGGILSLRSYGVAQSQCSGGRGG